MGKRFVRWVIIFNKILRVEWINIVRNFDFKFWTSKILYVLRGCFHDCKSTPSVFRLKLSSIVHQHKPNSPNYWVLNRHSNSGNLKLY